MISGVAYLIDQVRHFRTPIASIRTEGRHVTYILSNGIVGTIYGCEDHDFRLIEFMVAKSYEEIMESILYIQPVIWRAK